VTLHLDDLEALWERLARATDEAGDRSELFLAKLALLLAQRLGDAAVVEDAIAIALKDLR